MREQQMCTVSGTFAKLLLYICCKFAYDTVNKIVVRTLAKSVHFKLATTATSRLLHTTANSNLSLSTFDYNNNKMCVAQDVVCKSLSAYSVGQMLELMSQREVGDYSRVWSVEEPLLYWTLTLVLTLVVWVLSAHFYGFQMMRIGLHVRVGCSYLIYRKSLKLGQFESSQKTMGKMVSDKDRERKSKCFSSI